MNRYKVVEGPITLHPGAIVGLDEKQYARRAHVVKPRPDVGDGVYEATGPFDFKTGEEFVLVGEIGKGLLSRVTDMTPVPDEPETGEAAGDDAPAKPARRRRKR